ncbi:MAG: hypothetical protein KatS3mg038_2213 [Candidatus Kapaibacterium sp.]|nr:MAG: hypothetical protein KatS3mg038_2213 [Candidatus Kapabacteria bacterium]
MAVIAVEVKSITMATAIEDGRLVRDYRVTYRVRADDLTRDPVAIITSGHPLLPNAYSTYAFFGSVDAWARFVRWESISPAWEKHPGVWEAVAIFSTRPQRDLRDAFAPDDPLSEPTQWSISFSHETVAKDKWQDGTSITNSSKEPRFVDVIESHIIITARRNYPPTTNVKALADLVNGVNNASHWGFDAYTLRVADMSATQKFYQPGQYVWDISWSIEHKKSGWRVQFIDDGFTELNDAGGTTIRTPILDDNGMPVRERALLDGNGKRLPPNQQPVYYPPTPKAIYDEISFSALGLPNQIGAP